MKFYLLSIFLLLLTNTSICQINEGDLVELTKEIKVIGEPEMYITAVSSDHAAKYLGKYTYKVVSIEDDKVKLLALNFKTPKSTERKNNPDKVYMSDIYNNKIYTIAKTAFVAYATKAKTEKSERLTLGILTLPYKARSNGDGISFDTEFSLNTTVNLRLHNGYKNAYSINALLGSGIGNVGLNTSNAAGLDQNEAIDAATLSFLTGLMYEYDRVQIGLYVGWDYINNQDVYKWDGNGKMWFGLGIGYGIFGIAKEEMKNK